jgi:hypothetical protein
MVPIARSLGDIAFGFYIRCNKNGIINWEFGPLYHVEEPIEMNNVVIIEPAKPGIHGKDSKSKARS